MTDESENKVLTKDEIRRAVDYEIKVLEIPSWGGNVRIKSINGADRDQFTDLIAKNTSFIAGKKSVKMNGIMPAMLIMSVVDVNDKNVFEDNKEDKDLIQFKTATVTEEIFNACMVLSGLGDEAVDDAEKNLKSDLNASSGSDSPDSSEAAQ